MKKHLHILLIALWLAAFIALGGVTYAEGNLPALVDAGTALLFDTHNISITGKAEFRYDGKRFKTAEITYIQDYTNSYWQEKLLTPKANQPDRETGFTVIANQYRIFIMEPYTPGAYKETTCNLQNTILRDSLEARALLSYAKTAAAFAEHELAPDIAATENGVQISMDSKNVPSILNSVALMAGRFAARRLFGINYDENIIDRSGWDMTETRNIIFMTESCDIRSMSVRASLDTEGRLAGASGQLDIGLNYLNQEQHQLEIEFDLTVGQYGSSVIKPFNPDDYQVVPWEQALAHQRRLEDNQIEPLIERSYEMWKAAGYPEADSFVLYNWHKRDGVYYFTFKAPGDETKWKNRIEITETGNVLVLTRTPWQRFDRSKKEILSLEYEVVDYSEIMERISLFLKQANPELDFSALHPVSLERYGDIIVLELHGDPDENDFIDLDMTVQLTPDFRIEHYTCVGNG